MQDLLWQGSWLIWVLQWCDFQTLEEEYTTKNESTLQKYLKSRKTEELSETIKMLRRFEGKKFSNKNVTYSYRQLLKTRLLRTM